MPHIYSRLTRLVVGVTLAIQDISASRFALPRSAFLATCFLFVSLLPKTGNAATEIQKFLASDAAAGDLFGYSVAVSGDVAVIGAQGNDDNGTDSGSAYLFAVSPNISGSIPTTTWIKASSPYHVTGNITVLAGDTLTIEAGVEVVFDTTALFIVYGSLYANGTLADTVRFKKGTAASWKGIRVPFTGFASFSYTEYRDVNNSQVLHVFNGSFVANNSVFRNNYSAIYGGAMMVQNVGANINVNDCIYENNTGGQGAIHFNSTTSAASTITNCIFRNNVGTRTGNNGGTVALVNASNVTIDRCVFYNNTSAGYGGAVNVYAAGLRSAAFIKNCTFVNNTAVTGGAVNVSQETADSAFVWI